MQMLGPKTAVILAGGKATRMGGGDKCLLPVGGRPLLAHILDRLAGQVDQIGLNANGDTGRFDGFDLPIFSDAVGGQPGPLAGVLATMRWGAEAGADRVLTVAGDTPFFPCDLYARLAAADAPIAMAGSETADKTWRQPTFALWDVTLADALEAALLDGLRKIVLFTDSMGCETVPFDATAYEPFFNINTPEQIAEAEQMMESFEL